MTKLQIPSYRFHYYGRDEKNEYHNQREESLHSSQQTDYSDSSTFSSINAHDQKPEKVYSRDHLVDKFYSATELTAQAFEQPPQVNYNGHKQYGFPTIDPNTPIDSMPICTDCEPGKFRDQRSLKIPVDYQISSDSMKIALDQPSEVNYNSHNQYGSPPIDPNTSIGSMPICTDCGPSKKRVKRSIKIPVDYKIRSDSTKIA